MPPTQKLLFEFSWMWISISVKIYRCCIKNLLPPPHENRVFARLLRAAGRPQRLVRAAQRIAVCRWACTRSLGPEQHGGHQVCATVCAWKSTCRGQQKHPFRFEKQHF